MNRRIRWTNIDREERDYNVIRSTELLHQDSILSIQRFGRAELSAATHTHTHTQTHTHTYTHNQDTTHISTHADVCMAQICRSGTDLSVSVAFQFPPPGKQEWKEKMD